uniref:RING-type domain-containing protein n=1 Tax=Caenorhabditis tropicalis TaxID=1561998 RepID=A0A1I7TRI6_9PELO
MAPTKKNQNKRNANVAKKTSQKETVRGNEKLKELKEILKKAKDLEKQCAAEDAELKELTARLEILREADFQFSGCKVCSFDFSKARRIPRVIKCGHTVCNNCLFSKAKKNQFLVLENKHREYTCIGCKTKIQLPVERKKNDKNTPPNTAILTYICK